MLHQTLLDTHMIQLIKMNMRSFLAPMLELVQMEFQEPLVFGEESLPHSAFKLTATHPLFLRLLQTHYQTIVTMANFLHQEERKDPTMCTDSTLALIHSP